MPKCKKCTLIKMFYGRDKRFLDSVEKLEHGKMNISQLLRICNQIYQQHIEQLCN